MSSKQMKRLRKALKYQNKEGKGMPDNQYFMIQKKIGEEKNEETGEVKELGQNLFVMTDDTHRGYKLAKKMLNKGQIKLTSETTSTDTCNCEGNCTVKCDDCTKK